MDDQRWHGPEPNCAATREINGVRRICSWPPAHQGWKEGLHYDQPADRIWLEAHARQPNVESLPDQEPPLR